MNKSKKWAVIKTKFEGIHCFPKAPVEVSFLRHPHRHIFHVTVWIEQFHNDRDVEFIMFKRFIEKIIMNNKFPTESSCESMCDYIATKIKKKYKKRKIKIEIKEDDENGALIEYE